MGGCLDANPCTEDSCDASAGFCSLNGEALHGKPTPGVRPIAGDCEASLCANGAATTVVDDSEKGNPCTTSACAGTMPIHPINPPGSSCGGGNVCTLAGACVECLTDADCAPPANAKCGSVMPNQCCTPATCASLGKTCGAAQDGCGGMLACNNQQQDGTETGVDCGAARCPACPPTCSDGIENGAETDVDCGGGTCSPCGAGEMCGGPSDCASGVCAAGVCTGCTPPLLPTGVGCPGVCTGGCPQAGHCKIDCFGNQSCDGTQINCPANFNCTVDCQGEQACKQAQITCPPAHACNVLCGMAVQTCQQAEIFCGSGTCNLTCGGGTTCDQTELNCGLNACGAQCAGGMLPQVHCASSCDCTPC